MAGLTEEQRALQDAARIFAGAELPDLAREMEEKDFSVPAEMMRRYGEMAALMTDAVARYVDDVRTGDFPNEDESY